MNCLEDTVIFKSIKLYKYKILYLLQQHNWLVNLIPDISKLKTLKIL